MWPSQREQEGVLTFKCCIKVLFFIFGRESCVLRINYLDDWKYEIRRSSQLRTLLKRVVVNRTGKKFQARTGFEPMTSAIPVQRSTN